MAETYTSRTLRELVRIVASRFIGMAIIIAILVGAVSLASTYAPKWYRTEVQLMAKPSRIVSPLEGTSTSQREQVSLFVTTQREIIRSDRVLATALMLLDSPQKVPEDSYWRKAADKPLFTDGQIDEFILKNSERFRLFKKRLSIVTPGGPDATFTQTFKIQVDWPEIAGNGQGRENSKQHAAEDCFRLAKYTVHAYLTRYKMLEEKQTSEAARFLGKAVETAKAELDKAVLALQAEAEKLGSDLLPVASIIGQQGIDSGIATQVTRLESNVNKIDAELAEKRALKQAVDRELARKDPSQIAVPDEITKSNIAMNLLQQKVTRLKLDLNNLIPQYTNRYREVQTLKKELSSAYEDMHVELTKQSGRIGTSIALLQAQRGEFQSRLDMYHARMRKLGPAAIKYERIQKQLASAIDNYNDEEKQRLAAIRAEGLAKEQVLVSVLDDPSRPNADDPRRPVVWLNILIAAVGGIVLSLVYAFMADHFDHTIKSVDDAERYLGSPVLSSVPKIGRKIIRTR